jgi:hypothetical protein
VENEKKEVPVEPTEKELWLVIDETGEPVHCASWPDACHEHINDAINEFNIEGAEKWKVVQVKPKVADPYIGKHSFAAAPTASEKAWRAAVTNACVINHIDWDEENPQKSLEALIACEIEMALDPAISSRAQSLIDKSKAISPSAEQALRVAADKCGEIEDDYLALSDNVYPHKDKYAAAAASCRNAILSLTNKQDTSAEQGRSETWHVGAQNDSLYIINKKPRPSNDDMWHERPDGPTMVLPVHGLTLEQAQAICDAHNTSPPSADAMFNAGALRRLQDFSELMLHESGKTSVCYTCYTDLAKLVHDSLEPIITDLKRPTDMVVMSREELAKVQDALDSLASGTTDTKPPYRALNMCVSSRKIAQDAYKIVSRVKEGE